MTRAAKKTIAIPKAAQAVRWVVHSRHRSHLAFWGPANSRAKTPPNPADDSQRAPAEELADADTATV